MFLDFSVATPGLPTDFTEAADPVPRRVKRVNVCFCFFVADRIEKPRPRNSTDPVLSP